ncbi:50S ribosomal protein L23 [Candidatus Uhrbacteria bacterium RIFCSPHIGHO2_12_FULL_57_11]|uniref:Large ribosomal subunit protein uL23 n=2 Tax=Candidatus Uhriibacteriota TaxID=1752732 RepID=A0A1F7UJW3_9BACT|nr:MAG: 50S ribosomal protein L23 [Candidatus Uhrbacteria bacterium RIFCSPHIGHO2_02_FULL_57_19]OGL78570.1 MAG: 50S ribosomal protein L23 [Candidatus Uhrbacteria bacterium RIFCSPHIGHO2_12_FULL_57_11]
MHQPASEDTGQAYRVLLRPLVTEKGARLGESGQYVFIVARDATRIAVARAVEKVYGVRPLKVNIARVRGKQIRFGRTRGRQKDWKKALVILPPGKKIRVYEGV